MRPDAIVPPADDLFAVTIDDLTGSLTLNPKALSLGLAGGLLGDLLLQGVIRIRDGRVFINTPKALIPEEALAQRVVGYLLVEPATIDLSSWLEFFAGDAVELVSQRLHRSGWIQCQKPRRRNASPTYRPTEQNWIALRVLRVKRYVMGVDIPGWSEILLAGLVHAVGLFPRLFDRDAATAEKRLQLVLTQVNNRCPDLIDLIRHVETAVGSTALSARR